MSETLSGGVQEPRGRPPDVTVVIPTRNRREMLLRAVRSCDEAAGGTAVEVIVVDDGCTDGSVEAVRERHPAVAVLTGRTTGNRGRARNDGLERARGRFVKFLDDDDWLEPGALAAEVALAEHEDAGIVAGGHRRLGEDGDEQIHSPPPFADGIDSLLRGEAVPTGAALYRREPLADVRWDPNLSKLDDWQFFLRAGLRGHGVVPLHRVVYTWFEHEGQGIRSVSLLGNAREFYRILDELEERLESMGELDERRRRRLAQYRYKNLRVLCADDRPAFDLEVGRILGLDACFRPVDEERQPWMRGLARVVGFRRALLLHTAAKRLTAGLRGGRSVP